MDRKTVGQILATGTVVLFLGFVGFELRQNTAATRMTAFHSFQAGISENLVMLITDPILTPLFVRVTEGAMPADFDAEERFRLRLNFNHLLRQWEGLFRSVDQGILPDEVLNTIGQGRAFDNPYFRSIWPTEVRPSYDQDFVEFFEGLRWNVNR